MLDRESPMASGPAGTRVDEAAVGALWEAMAQLCQAVRRLDDARYAAASGVLGGTVGGHVRHCLDHIRALFEAARTGVVDYDRRERGTAVETDRQAAVAAMSEAIDALAGLSAQNDGPVVVRSTVAADGAAVTTGSTLGREVVFALSHTVHHQAIIAGIIRSLGGEVEDGFGVAPATLMTRKACDVHGDPRSPA